MPTGTQPTTALPELLTSPEVAAALRIHVATAKRMIARGELPTLRVGRRRYVTHAALAAYLDAQAVPATSGPLAGRTA